MNVHVRDRLSRVGAVLKRDGEAAGCEVRRVGEVELREELLRELHRGEEICCLGGGEVQEAAVRLEGADEDVAWEEGLEVDEAVGMGGCEEDLLGDLEGAKLDVHAVGVG